MIRHHPHGKFLLTAEYFVLDGVPALAVPTRPGQRFSVREAEGAGLRWTALNADGSPWFEHYFTDFGGAGAQVWGKDPESRLRQVFAAAESLRPGSTDRLRGKTVETRLEFDRHWGLGSSSTLIAALARYLDVDPYALLESSFGGSGYDLACAFAAGPLVYERNGTTPRVTELTDWQPAWTRSSYFVYRNQKQNSREGIRAYRSREIDPAVREEIGRLTLALQSPTLHLRSVAQLFARHERLVGDTLGLPPVKEVLFGDFPGAIKSLGAWGGDFVWAVSEQPPEKVRAYFNERGFGVVIPYADLVKSGNSSV